MLLLWACSWRKVIGRCSLVQTASLCFSLPKSATLMWRGNTMVEKNFDTVRRAYLTLNVVCICVRQEIHFSLVRTLRWIFEYLRRVHGQAGGHLHISPAMQHFFFRACLLSNFCRCYCCTHRLFDLRPPHDRCRTLSENESGRESEIER